MKSFIKLINVEGGSFIYDAFINKVQKLPENIIDKDFTFTNEYLCEKHNMYKHLLDQGFFQGYELKNINSQLVENSNFVINYNLERINI